MWASAAARTHRTRLKQPTAEPQESTQDLMNSAAPSSPPSPTPQHSTATVRPSHQEVSDILMQLSTGSSDQTPLQNPDSKSSFRMAAEHLSTTNDGATGPLSESGSSSLSELAETLEDDQGSVSVHDSDGSSSEPDTEAETERLDVSPQKNRKVEVAAASKPPLEDGHAVDVEEEHTDDERVNEGTASPERLLEDLVGRKRKRMGPLSPERDVDEEEHARKRSASRRHTVGRLSGSRRSLRDALGDDIMLKKPAEDDEALSDDSEDGEENEEDDAKLLEALTPGEGLEKPLEGDEDAESSGRDLSEPPDDPEALVDAIQEDGDAAAAEVDEEEAAAKNEDEMARKKLAMDALKPIENLFAIFRDKLYDERLALLSTELELLNQPEPSHLEYLAMRQALDARRDEKIAQEHVTLDFKVQALERRIIAERASLHSHFYQAVRDTRERHLEQTNEQFSRIQRERRQFKAKEPQYVYKYNPKRSLQIANQRSHNKEISLLSGLAKHVGFPAAPEMVVPKGTDVEGDLRSMKIRQRPTQYVNQIADTRADEAAAEEAFFERNAWANPQHPSHQQSRMIERHALVTAALQSTPGSQRKISDVQHGSASTLNAISPPLPAVGLGITDRNEQSLVDTSSPFEHMKRRNMEASSINDTAPREDALGAFQALAHGTSRDRAGQQPYHTSALHSDHSQELLQQGSYAPHAGTFGPPGHDDAKGLMHSSPLTHSSHLINGVPVHAARPERLGVS